MDLPSALLQFDVVSVSSIDFAVLSQSPLRLRFLECHTKLQLGTSPRCADIDFRSAFRCLSKFNVQPSPPVLGALAFVAYVCVAQGLHVIIGTRIGLLGKRQG